MRVRFYAAAILAVATLISPESLRSALATASSALLEATPFLLGGVALTHLLGRRWQWMAYLGCGCGAGPSARSLPAAAATWLAFGPAVALARLAAAAAVSRLTRRSCDRHHAHDGDALLPELTAFLPAALTASVAMQLAASFDPHATGAAANVAIGVLLGFTAAPCALGSVAVAGALHARAPLAAASFLCVAGIVDARALRLRILPRNSGHDALAYVMLTIALASVAWRHGAALVHPAIAGVLAACALVTAALALVHRSHQCARARVAPAIVLAGAMLSAPPPVYRATETTLSGLFAGERLSFTGVVVRGARSDALVRFAITCCRADATPVGVRLAQRATERTGSWVRADGTVEGAALDLRLRVTSLQQIAPPADPFIYR